ncbi:uncharacterized protein LOC128227258 [Mya arenaria]|uniref:uncharacterized protein LOC128227258 n=1 Tax=Mya arenaria TaxID=6604 RepID=UPI0022E03AAC|nr:uncharacterized protein LOC128227258 [Mya arenaria]
MFEFVLIVVAGVHACTWPAEFAGSVWLDSDRGQVAFTSVSVTGWSITAQGDQEVSGWDCYFHNTTGTGYTLAMQAQGTFVIFKTEYRAFACLQLTRVADSTFIYYLMSEEETRLYKDRLYVKVEPNGTQATPSAADVCLAASHAEAPPANEYHLFIKNVSS